MRRSEKLKLPAPNYYFKDQKAKPLKATSCAKGDKFCGFVEHARWEAGRTKGPGQYHDKVSYKLTTPREFEAVYHKESEKQAKKDSRIEKIQKDRASLSPGQYEDTKAFFGTQVKNLKYGTCKDQRIPFTD